MDLQSKTHFNRAPTITKRRTRFDLSHPVLTTFNTGDFVPVFCEPVYPGETHSLVTSSLTRLETSLHQTMDNAYLEFAFFFVPLKTVFDNFDKFLGANDDAWAQTQEYHLPQIKMVGHNISGSGAGTQSVTVGSMYQQLFAPAGSYGHSIAQGETSETAGLSYDATPIFSVFQVYNDWYRDENYDSIIYFDKSGTDIYLNDGFLFNGAYFKPQSSILKVNRFKDLFSTALPAPQKGQEVSLGLAGVAPIIGDTNFYSYGYQGIRFTDSDIGALNAGDKITNPSEPEDSTLGFESGLFAYAEGFTADGQVTGSNMVADLSKASSITINQLRLAIAAQAISERDARGGTRLKEKTYAEWGVHVNDLEIDRSEFLGGKRIPVSMMEVLQTSETGTTVLGTDAGHSKTVDSSESFVRSFTQYGWILGFMYVRTSRNYSQGIDRKFRNKDIYSLYDPMLDNIGELAIEKSELYALKTSSKANVEASRAVAGYQEAWYHLKERTGRFTGYFQPGVTGTLDSWHYGDSYSDIPTISADWLKESEANVDRTIAVSSNASFQWSANIYFEYYATRTAGKYSIPNTFGF